MAFLGEIEMTTQETNLLIDYEIATSNRRLIARLIDLAIVFFVFSMIAGLFTYTFSILFKPEGDVSTWFFVVIFLLLMIAYDTLMLRYLGKTVGKMALGLKVVDIKGERLTWGMCLVRAMVLYLCGIGIGFLTGVTMTLFGWVFISGLKRYKRFPQDSAASSFVVRETKGQLVSAASINPLKPTPLADLDRLYEQGMISKEEWERKKEQLEK
jgi:uncharacterized RDD family membrane protein YckC